MSFRYYNLPATGDNLQMTAHLAFHYKNKTDQIKYTNKMQYNLRKDFLQILKQKKCFLGIYLVTYYFCYLLLKFNDSTVAHNTCNQYMTNVNP